MHVFQRCVQTTSCGLWVCVGLNPRLESVNSLVLSWLILWYCIRGNMEASPKFLGAEITSSMQTRSRSIGKFIAKVIAKVLRTVYHTEFSNKPTCVEMCSARCVNTPLACLLKLPKYAKVVALHLTLTNRSSSAF